MQEPFHVAEIDGAAHFQFGAVSTFNAFRPFPSSGAIVRQDRKRDPGKEKRVRSECRNAVEAERRTQKKYIKE